MDINLILLVCLFFFPIISFILGLERGKEEALRRAIASGKIHQHSVKKTVQTYKVSK